MRRQQYISDLEIGRQPLVVGTITTTAGLERAAGAGGALPCHIAEVRLDRIGWETPAWQDGGRILQQQGTPVLVTIRHPMEGGGWSGPEWERLELYRAAVPWAAGLDVEIQAEALTELRPLVDESGGILIGSFHDFASLPGPDELDRIVRAGVSQGADVIKIAVWLADDNAIAEAAGVLDRFSDVPLAVVGMGPKGPEARRQLPQRGSCLTYGFLDAAAAPGQAAATDLWARFGRGGGALD